LEEKAIWILRVAFQWIDNTEREMAFCNILKGGEKKTQVDVWYSR
jgi:hypothetical protein